MRGWALKSKPQARLGPNNREQLTENREKMRFLTFDQIKAQLRLDDEQATQERDLLITYGEAAEDAVLNVCNRTITDIYSTYGNVPTGFVVAALLLVDDTYNNRGTITRTCQPLTST